MKPEPKNPLIERAIEILGRQSDLALAIECAQQTVSKLLNNEIRVSAEQAVAIHRATNGRVSKRQLRPDLWSERASA
jgi:DNA-binding transcriptional regulator YdaS (Cro superfamily)